MAYNDYARRGNLNPDEENRRTAQYENQQADLSTARGEKIAQNAAVLGNKLANQQDRDLVIWQAFMGLSKLNDDFIITGRTYAD